MEVSCKLLEPIVGGEVTEIWREKEYGRTVRKENFFLPENTINALEMADRKY
jgi:hypothetical protein